MKKLILGVFLVLLLIPLSQSFSQGTQINNSALSVTLQHETPFLYHDSEGYAVVVGAVKNHDSQTYVSNVKIQAIFYDQFGLSPIDIVSGNSTLQVIPPNGISPFVIRSSNPNPDITDASVSLLAPIVPSSEKLPELIVYSSETILDSSFRFSGVLQNIGAPNSDTNVYLAFYDVFDRILSVSTIELGDIAPDAEIKFNLDEEINQEAVGFLLFAESDVFNSNFVDIKIPPKQSLTKLVSITGVSVQDIEGNNLSEIEFGSIVNIVSKTNIQFSEEQSTDETPYTYYIQIKESGKSPTVEYIGKYDGRFIENGLQYQTIDWEPRNSGLFFIETFVWDRNNVPLSEQGPFILINVQE